MILRSVAAAFEDAWYAYRVHVVYRYYMWAVTRLVEPRITNEFVRRLGLAVVALDREFLAQAFLSKLT